MYKKLNFDETYRKTIRKLLQSGMFDIGRSGKLVPAKPKGVLTTPWVFTNYDARRKYCHWWNSVYCGEFALIPRFCRFNCWKTVIYPNNVYELFQLADILRKENLPSKCGVDRRKYTYRAWGGYVYGDTLRQGKEYYAQVREAVNNEIGNQVDIILKRGCTEMERLRPSNTWDAWTEEERMLEFQLDDLFEFNEIDFHQSAWLHRDIKENWLLRAIEIADPTVEETIKDYGREGLKLEDLIVKSITYHDKG